MSPKVFKCIQKSPNDPNKSKTGPRVGKGGKHGVQSTSSVDPGYIQAIYRLHPSYTQHTSGMIHATFRPKLRRRKGLHLPDVRRPTIPFCIFFVFLRFLKSLVLCDISCFAGAVLPPSQMVLFHLKDTGHRVVIGVIMGISRDFSLQLGSCAQVGLVDDT